MLTRYFSNRKRHKKKTVIAAHSMGSTVRFSLHKSHRLTSLPKVLLVRSSPPLITPSPSLTRGLQLQHTTVLVIAFPIRNHPAYSLTYCYSFKWVESPEHGGGGSDWVEVSSLSVPFYDLLLLMVILMMTSLCLQNHIEAYISIAGTHLVC